MSEIIVNVCGEPLDKEKLSGWNEKPAPGVDKDHVYRCICGACTFESLHAYVGVGFNIMPGIRSICTCCGSMIELRRRDFDGTEMVDLIDRDKETRFMKRRMKRLSERRGSIKSEYCSKSGGYNFTGLEVLEILDRALNHKPLEGEATPKDHALYEDIKDLLLENCNADLYDKTKENVFLRKED